MGRLLNTGENYGNNVEIGTALETSGVRREHVWVTTKVCPTNFGFKNTLKSIQKSLSDFGTTWVDL